MVDDRLVVDGMHCRYGDIEAVHGISFDVRPGEVLALLGANGAGKTTTLRAVAGLMRPGRGRITIGGRDVTRSPAHRRVRRGVALVPEGRHVCSFLTVADNLRLSLIASRRNDRPGLDLGEIYELFGVLYDRREQEAGSLSGGEQQMLATARALLTRPRFLLLDEPSMGLSPIMVDALFERLIAIRDRGIAMVVVEQNADLAMEFADRIAVLQRGHITTIGVPGEVEFTGLSEAYLA